MHKGHSYFDIGIHMKGPTLRLMSYEYIVSLPLITFRVHMILCMILETQLQIIKSY